MKFDQKSLATMTSAAITCDCRQSVQMRIKLVERETSEDVRHMIGGRHARFPRAPRPRHFMLEDAVCYCGMQWHAQLMVDLTVDVIRLGKVREDDPF